MKRNVCLSLLLVSLCAILCFSSCMASMMGPDEMNYSDAGSVSKELLSITTPRGDKLNFSKAYISVKSEVEECSWLCASTSMVTASDFLTLSAYFPPVSTWTPGTALKPQESLFAKPLSSDSRDYCHKYTGNIVCIGISGAAATLIFENVVFTLADGKYTLDGQLVCELLN